MNKKRLLLDDLLDKSFVYCILLTKAERYNNRLKLLFKIPIIITSAILGVLNSNNNDNFKHSMEYINPTFNIITTLVLSFGALLNLEQKEHDFKQSKIAFSKLHSIIETKMINDEEITSDFVSSIQNQYNMVEENINYEIPSFICRNVRNEYKEIKTLPTIINGIKKKIEYRNPSFSYDSPLNSIKKESIDCKNTSLSGNIVYMKTPSVLDVKPINVINL